MDGRSPCLLQASEIERSASLLVSCTACGKLHKPEQPLASNPVCPPCTGRYAQASVQMSGAHPLTAQRIDEEVTRTSSGNYALGYLDGGTFLVFYVGRADADLNERLQQWVGAESRCARYAPSTKAAWGSSHRRSRPSRTPALCPVGVVMDGRYTHFQFSYAPSSRTAFEKECRNYHDFGCSYGLDNERHPAAPEGVEWHCPVHDGGWR
jgi:hypothetical protein